MRIQRGFRGFGQLAILAAVPVASVLVTGSASAAAKIVACIGEQTTSTTDTGPITNCWPTLLGTMLGAGYDVGNDVVTNGNTVTSGNCVTAASLAGPPAIVVIGPFAEHDYAAGI